MSLGHGGRWVCDACGEVTHPDRPEAAEWCVYRAFQTEYVAPGVGIGRDIEVAHVCPNTDCVAMVAAVQLGVRPTPTLWKGPRD